jgi:uncharacterized protein involved in response to NO
MTACAAGAAIIHALRMFHYHSLKTFKDPMLWILHAGYLWLVIGLGLLALSGTGISVAPMVIHALTAGCIGSMTLGMMTRVTLGHTGRDLIASKLTILSFILIQLAALMRVFGPILMPERTTDWFVISAVLWAVCYSIYLFVYTPMLINARPDGQKP